MDDKERFYRGIKRSQPSVITGEGRVSSALFKEERIDKDGKCGVSVTLEANREQSIVFEQFDSAFGKRLKGIVRLTQEDVKKAKAFIFPSPSLLNPYHAEIFQNEAKETLTNLQSLILADLCEMVCLKEDVPWV